MSYLDSPASILFDTNSTELAVTASAQIPTGTRGLLAAGVDSTGIVRYFRTDANGQLFITGSVTASLAAGGALGATAPTSGLLVAGISSSLLQPISVYNVSGSNHVIGAQLRSLVNGQSVEIGSRAYPFFVDTPPEELAAFGETRTVQPISLAEYVNKYEIDTLEYFTSSAGGGSFTHVPSSSAIRLSVGSAAGDRATLQTNTYFRYRAAKGMNVVQTLFLNSLTSSNQVMRWGLFDSQDGLFWAFSGSTTAPSFSIVRRTSTSGTNVTEQIVSSSIWNWDKLDGNGISRFRLNLRAGNIFQLKYQWLGVGEAFFLVDKKLAHEMDNSNLYAAPYMKTGQLPLTFEVENVGASSGNSLTYICSAVQVEGSPDPGVRYSFAAYMTSTLPVVSANERSIITIRPSLLYRNITNRGIILPFRLSISAISARTKFRIVQNMTVTNQFFTNNVDPYSSVQFDTNGNTGISGGQTLYYGLIESTTAGTADVDLTTFFSEFGRKLRLNAPGTVADTLTICGRTTSGGTADVQCSISFYEIR